MSLSRLSLLFLSMGLFSFVYNSYGELPPELPGDEITDQYLHWRMPQDSSSEKTKITKPSVEWYDKVAKTWEALSISEQMSLDRTLVPMGKGGIFIPKLTELHKEPDIEIIDSTGKTILTGEPGKTYSVEPGVYKVMVGNGTHKQRIVHQVNVEESKTIPILPDWSGLIIETVDTNSTVIRGEYELVRIDEFEPYGRGYGADVGMGEAVKSWILKPGIYKIFGRGQSYNTMKNFVTVRLIPGELSRFILIQRPEDFSIMGGGTVDIEPGTKIASNWKYGGNIGGNVQFVNKDDKTQNGTKNTSSMLSLTSSLWLRYLHTPVDWETTIGFTEGLNLAEQSSDYVISTAADEFKLRSLFIWRFFRWIGPYGISELSTNLFPKNINRENKGYFTILDHNYEVNENELDSTKGTFRLNPSLCPLTADVGGGVNVDALNLNSIDVAVRIGAGSSYSYFPDKYKEVADDAVKRDSLRDSVTINKSHNAIFLYHENKTDLLEFGPLFSVSALIRLGRFGTSSTELKVFAPIYPEKRLSDPDYELSNVLSWQITRSVTLDYVLNYQLKQPEKKDAQVDQISNTVLLRFSLSSR